MKIVDGNHLTEQLVFEGKVYFKSEDGGQALIAEVESKQDECIFVRVQSWDERKQHEVAFALQGKRVRLVLTVIPDEVYPDNT
jgi:hypothetical protein